jgi:hypothetical protein
VKIEGVEGAGLAGSPKKQKRKLNRKAESGFE